MTELVMPDSDLATGTLGGSSTLPRSARRCRIPRLNRSTSVRLRSGPGDVQRTDPRPKSMSLSQKDCSSWSRYGDMASSTASMPFDDDAASVKSFVSYNSSFASHASRESSSRPISRTHYGKKYVLHCDRHLVKQEEYLTPTQRKDREIRQLKSALLKQGRSSDEKDGEIRQLKDELRRLQDAFAELQIGKDSLMNSSQESDSLNPKNSSEISFESNASSEIRTTVTVNNNDDSGISNVMSISLSPRDSTEFDEADSPQQVHPRVLTADKAVCTDLLYSDSQTPPRTDAGHSRSSDRSDAFDSHPSGSGQEERYSLVAPPRMSMEFDRFLGTYKKELEELKSQHKEQYQDLKERFNDRVDDLLRKLSEANTRYLELRPLFDRAQDKIENIESQLSEVQKDIETQEEYHNQMYLKMYRKGQEAARFEQQQQAVEDNLEFSPPPSKRASVPDLLRQLQQMQAELDQTKQLYREAARGMGDRQAEYTLRFLKDAVFYFLTKKDKEHLKAIQSILGFTDAERMAVAKAMKHRRL